jgi:glucose/arabinose dehydrogenase
VGDLALRLELVAGGLNGSVNRISQLAPIDMTPLGDGRQLVLTLGGAVRLLDASKTLVDGLYLNTNNANSTTDEDEMLPVSIAAHPDFHSPGAPGYGKFYTITFEKPGTTSADFGFGVHHQDVLNEWSVDPAAIDATSLMPGINVTKREVMRIDRPSQIHFMSDLAFDALDYLYVTSGEGGAAGEAQDTTNVFGTVLRIDPLEPALTAPSRGTTGGQFDQYRIHPDNSFAADADPNTPGEIFSYGHRSPFRISVDEGTGDVWLGEVGGGSREEINRLVNGGNFGWPLREGTGGSHPAGGSIDPVFELLHNDGVQSESTNIVGGFVYRGSIPELFGRYIFADFGENNGGQPTNVVEVMYGDTGTTSASARDDFFSFQIDVTGMPLPERIYSIAEDESGEIYLLGGPDRFDFFNGTDGTILKVNLGQLPPPPGDLDGDRDVDTDDWQQFRTGLGGIFAGMTPAEARANGDMDGDLDNDLDDFRLFVEAFNASQLNDSRTSGASAATNVEVPEPTTFVLLIALLFVLATTWNRRAFPRVFPVAHE